MHFRTKWLLELSVSYGLTSLEVQRVNGPICLFDGPNCIRSMQRKCGIFVIFRFEQSFLTKKSSLYYTKETKEHVRGSLEAPASKALGEEEKTDEQPW